MVQASDALAAWIAGTRSLAPPVDVAYCSINGPDHTLRHTSCPAPLPGPGGLPAASAMGAMGVEPAMRACNVRHPSRPPGEGEAKASTKARIIHPLALTLVEDHGYDWRHALQVATRCFEQLDGAVLGALGSAAPAPDAGADSEGEAEAVVLGEDM